MNQIYLHGDMFYLPAYLFILIYILYIDIVLNLNVVGVACMPC